MTERAEEKQCCSLSSATVSHDHIASLIRLSSISFVQFYLYLQSLHSLAHNLHCCIVVLFCLINLYRVCSFSLSLALPPCLIFHVSSPCCLSPSFFFSSTSSMDSRCNEPINWSNTVVATGQGWGRVNVMGEGGESWIWQREGDRRRKKRENEWGAGEGVIPADKGRDMIPVGEEAVYWGRNGGWGGGAEMEMGRETGRGKGGKGHWGRRLHKLVQEFICTR